MTDKYSASRTEAVTRARAALSRLAVPCILLTMYDETGQWVTANLVTDHEVVEIARIGKRLLCSEVREPWLEMLAILLKSALVKIFKVKIEIVNSSRTYADVLGEQIPNA
jgi:hypothetical protein